MSGKTAGTQGLGVWGLENEGQRKDKANQREVTGRQSATSVTIS